MLSSTLSQQGTWQGDSLRCVRYCEKRRLGEYWYQPSVLIRKELNLRRTVFGDGGWRWDNLVSRKPGDCSVFLGGAADAGGSNSHRTKLGKVALRELSNELKLDITVCHFPPGTSQWNKIEHRLFSFISQNWRGQPLYDLATIVNFISHTTTSEGLIVRCAVDDTQYEKGIKVTDAELKACGVKNHNFHGEWNYNLEKQKIR